MPKPSDYICICGIDCESKCVTHSGAITCSVGTLGHMRHVVEVANPLAYDIDVTCESAITNTANLEFVGNHPDRWSDTRTVRGARRGNNASVETFGRVPVRSFYGVAAHETIQTKVKATRPTAGKLIALSPPRTTTIEVKL